MTQAGWLIKYVQDLNDEIVLHAKPNGTKEFPAPSCCSLKKNYPDIESGTSLLMGWGGAIVLCH